jgi:hypothetical protein
MRKIAEEAKPITGRGIGYKLFAAGLIKDMSEMPKVYRALKVAREDSEIPWDWIIDETRELELISTWNDPTHCAHSFFYRRDSVHVAGCCVRSACCHKRSGRSPKSVARSGLSPFRF